MSNERNVLRAIWNDRFDQRCLICQRLRPSRSPRGRSAVSEQVDGHNMPLDREVLAEPAPLASA
jgi:hypothetical protein